MNKVLVKVFFPRIDKSYDIWIPLNLKVYDVIKQLIKGVNELNDNLVPATISPILYNKESGEYYNPSSIIKDTNIRNCTELILM